MKIEAMLRRKRMKYATLLFAIAVAMSGCDSMKSSTAPVNATPQRDNSAVNQRDRSGTSVTPLDQHENKKDIDITADIRKQVVGSKLSVNARNVKIVTQDGNVTLRGPVASAEEKSTIEAIARRVAGDDKVDNQLDVATSK
jgi:osmotically-inducible protein OsmY